MGKQNYNGAENIRPLSHHKTVKLILIFEFYVSKGMFLINDSSIFVCLLFHKNVFLVFLFFEIDLRFSGNYFV